MSFRSKRSRLTQLSKANEPTSQTLQDVVTQVISDVANVEEDQDEDTNQSSCLNQDTDQTAAAKPTQTTVVGLAADGFKPRERNAGRRRSFTPSPSQPLVTDSHKWSARSQPIDDQSNQGVASGGLQTEAFEIGSGDDAWTSDPLTTEPAQLTAKETNDLRPSQNNTAGRPSLAASSSRTFLSDSLGQPRRVQRRQNWVHEEEDAEPSQRGISVVRHPNPSGWDNDLEDEMEEEMDGEPGQHGFSRCLNSDSVRWSNDISFDEMEEVEMRDSEGRRGKKGGGILPRHVWSLRPGVRFVVPFNSLHQPVRKGGHVLIRFLGDVAKNSELCPIGEVSWPRVDKSIKANIIALIREKFVLPDRLEVDKCILKHVGNRWKAHRHDLKLQYKLPDKTQEQVASTVPKGVPPSQWVKLVQYWFSEKCKILSKKGKEARAAQTHLHITGSKSFARKRDEFEKAHGREPGAVEWFLETHKRKDGTFVEDTSKEFVDAAAALIAQRGSTSSRRTTVENQVFNELMYSDDERLYKRPLGYGFGVNGNTLFGAEAESRKRGYRGSSIKAEIGSSKRKMFQMGTERMNSGHVPPDSTAEVERLNFAMTAMGETNQLMQGQIKMQSQQLQMQSQQLQMQSKQIEGLQVQLQQVTSLLTKFGVMLNNRQTHHAPRGAFFQGMKDSNRQVPDASPEYSDEESDSTDWDSD